MIASSISDILIVSGAVTALAGLPAVFAPGWFLRYVFGVNDPQAATGFFVRHWGVLIFAVGMLLAGSAFTPSPRPLVLGAAALEKFAIVALIAFGPLKRTPLMTAAAIVDGAFALIYSAYLLGA
jgi:hypothetical protein